MKTDTEKLRELADFVVTMRNDYRDRYRPSMKIDDVFNFGMGQAMMACNFILDKMSAMGIEV